VVKAAGDIFLLIEAVPIDGGEANGMTSGVKNAIALSVERRSDG
jgi:hypothetical protein